jgi:DNA-binding CsgD family transcriptional regulator
MTHRAVIGIILLVQFVCAFFFVGEIMASVFGIAYQPLDWAFVELIEIGAALGLILGVVLGGLALRESFRRTRRAEEALRRASTAFMEVLEERFSEWGLTPAERDVALFAIKGLSTQEIATMRSTSEGTVKAQTNAIYRKAGVSGRPQLLSLFIDDLMDDTAPEPAVRLTG